MLARGTDCSRISGLWMERAVWANASRGTNTMRQCVALGLLAIVSVVFLNSGCGRSSPENTRTRAPSVSSPSLSDSESTLAEVPSLGSEVRPPRSARFRPLASLPTWRLPYCPAGGSPWSSDGKLLALTNGQVLAVFDAMHPEEPPKVVHISSPPTNMTISWSPVGRWIACHTKSYTRPEGARGVVITDSLWAVPVDEGRAVPVATRDVWPFLWASDGYIYGWEGTTIERFPPPNPWRARNPVTAQRITRVVYTLGQGTVFFTPGNPPTAVRVPTSIGHVFEGDPFPGGGLFIIRRYAYGPGTPAYGAVVDVRGVEHASLDGPAREDSSGTNLGPAFGATTVTADGQYVLGYYEVDRDEDVAKAVVYVVGRNGGSRIPVEGACYSVQPECSPRGNYLALEALHGGVEVGVLEIAP